MHTTYVYYTRPASSSRYTSLVKSEHFKFQSPGKVENVISS